MLRMCLLLAGFLQATFAQDANLAGYRPQNSAGGYQAGPGLSNLYLSSASIYPGRLGSAYSGALNYGLGYPLYGGPGYGSGILSPVGRYGLTREANSYNPTGKNSENLKLSGSARFVDKDGYNTGAHSLAVTVAKNAPSLLFGDYLGGQGLSMTLQIQSSLGGYYHVVMTSLARIQDGCSADTLGDILTNPSSYYPMYRGATFGDAGLPEGVVAFVELGNNVQKSLYVGRIPQFDKLDDLAGRGVAICAADGPDTSKTPCRGQIVACVGLAYSKDEASLPTYDKQSYQGQAYPQQPYNPSKTPQQPYEPPKTPQSPSSPTQTGGKSKTPADDYYSGQPNLGSRYYDGNSPGEYDSNNQLVDTYNPPQTPTEYEYEPNLSQRPKAKQGPIWTGSN